MTTELEQEFYETFGIEPISKWHKCKDYSCVCCDEYDNCSKREFIYPEITDRKLLELICIQGNIDYFMIDNSGNPISVNGLKNSVLHTLTLISKNHKELKQQIKQLFKGGE